MKLKTIIVAFLVALITTSCKDESKKLPEQATEAEADNTFTVTLNAIVKKDDSFQLYYRSSQENNFDEQNSIFVEFKGSEQPQNIVFTLPEDTVPDYLRLDFGTNKEQDEIIIKNFNVKYLGKDIEVNGQAFFDYFTPNEQTVTFDRQKSGIKPILTKEGVYDPMAFSNQILTDKVKTISQ